MNSAPSEVLTGADARLCGTFDRLTLLLTSP